MSDNRAITRSSNPFPSLGDLLGDSPPEHPAGRAPVVSEAKALHLLQRLESTQAPAQANRDKVPEDLKLSIRALKCKGFTNQQILEALGNARDLPFPLEETEIEELCLGRCRDLEVPPLLETSLPSEEINSILLVGAVLLGLLVLWAMFT